MILGAVGWAALVYYVVIPEYLVRENRGKLTLKIIFPGFTSYRLVSTPIHISLTNWIDPLAIDV